MQDVWRVYGTVTCKADLEGMVPEVTINLSHQPDSASHVPLDHLIVHPCVTSADTAQIPHSGKWAREYFNHKIPLFQKIQISFSRIGNSTLPMLMLLSSKAQER